MKRFLIVFLTVVFMLALCSCGESVATGTTEPPETSVPDASGGGETTEHIHIPSNAVRENETDPTCKNVGGYDEVVYCTECGDELARRSKVEPALPHRYVENVCTACGDQQSKSVFRFTSNGDGTCTLSGLVKCDGDFIDIPSTSPSGETVTAIASRAFYNQNFISHVRMPDTVTSIGADAFAFCANITSIVLSDNLTSLGSTSIPQASYGFAYNEYDGAYYIGSESNPYLVLAKLKDSSRSSYKIHEDTRFIYNHAFSSNKNLTGIALPDSVISIGANAFINCSSLSEVILPSSLTVIEGNAFSHCSSLTSVSIPGSVKSIGVNAFAFCNSLERVELGEGIESIESNAFYFCGKLKGVTLPSSLRTLGDSAFSDCSSLASVSLPTDLAVIERGAFSRCKSLAEITMPERLTSIGYMAFSDCTALKSITIPATVKLIDNYAFQGCNALESVTFECTEGWRYFRLITDTEGTAVDVTVPTDNARYLLRTYRDYEWRRS